MDQLTLGEMISTLKRKDPERDVYFDFVHFRPDGIHSYRGYYEQLALGYKVYPGGEDCTVKGLLALCEGALGKTFTGYKGGNYVMHEKTPLWVANYNESGGTAIVDIQDQDWRLVLVTASVD